MGLVERPANSSPSSLKDCDNVTVCKSCMFTVYLSRHLLVSVPNKATFDHTGLEDWKVFLNSQGGTCIIKI